MLAAAFDLACRLLFVIVIVIIPTLTPYNIKYKTWNKLRTYNIYFTKENVYMTLNVKDLYKCIKYVKRNSRNILHDIKTSTRIWKINI